MAIEHIIFDCDGVLIDSEWLSCRAEAQVFAELGAEVTPEFVRDTYVGMDNATMYADFERRFGIALPADFGERHHRALFALFDRELEPMAGIVDVLQDLSTGSSVASNSAPDRLNYSLALTGLDAHFGAHIYSAEQVARPKPATDLFELVLERTGATAATTLVVEDGASGALAARTLGMPVLGFTGGSHCTPRTREKLQDAGARHIFDEMADLPSLLAEL